MKEKKVHKVDRYGQGLCMRERIPARGSKTWIRVTCGNCLAMRWAKFRRGG